MNTIVSGADNPEYEREPDGSIREEIFTYEVLTPTLPPAQEQLAVLRINSDSDFIWQRASYFHDFPLGAPRTPDDENVPLVTLRILDPLSQRALMSDAVPLTSIFGLGEFPFHLPVRKKLPASASLFIYLTGFQAGGVGNYPPIRLQFHGVKRFLKAQPALTD